MRSIFAMSVGFVLLLQSGCGPAKLNETKTFNVSDGDKSAEIYTMPAQKVEQNITISVQADQPVNIYVILSKDQSDIPSKLPQEWEKAAISVNKAAKTEPLKAKIPPNQEWNIVVTPGAKTTKASGTLKISN